MTTCRGGGWLLRIPASGMYDFAFERPQAVNFRPDIVIGSSCINHDICLVVDDFSRLKLFDLKLPEWKSLTTGRLVGIMELLTI